MTDPTIRAALYYKAVTEGASGAINAALSDNNPRRAAQLLDAYKGHMDGDEQLKLWGRVHEQLDHAVATDAARTTPSQPGIPYTPATNLLTGTGLNAGQYNAYREALAAPESGGDYTKVNAGGYAGRYQLGEKERAETAKRLGEPVPTLQQFRSDPQMQERFFESYTLDHHNTLMANPAYANASPQRKAAILAGAHLGGVEGVNAYLATGEDRQDSNKTRVSSYINRMTQAMGGTAAASGTPTPAPAGAPTATPAATPSPGAPPAAGGPVEVWGDSLGVGLRNHIKGEGYAVGGARPSAILANIQKQPDSYWQGKTIVLPSGSNGNEMPVVEETIQYLQGKGARVIAVGYGPKFPEKNAALQEIARRLNVPVIAAEGVGATEGVHPSSQGYQRMARRVREATAIDSALSAPGASRPGVPGMVEPGNI